MATGTYQIVLPAGPAPAEGYGAIFYFHGYQGSAAEVMADAELVALVQRLGVALIAPNGLGRSWSFPGSPARYRDEFAFVAAMLDDIAHRASIDPRRLMATGFSQGGSMVWYLACRMPARFAAFAPIAGAFWEPLPQSCSSPRPRLTHVHGTADTVVPIAGRLVRQGFRQGDLFRGFAVMAPGCTSDFPAMVRSVPPGPAPTCRQANCGGARLELCLHDGGHVAEAAWIERAWRLTMTTEPTPPATPLTSP